MIKIELKGVGEKVTVNEKTIIHNRQCGWFETCLLTLLKRNKSGRQDFTCFLKGRDVTGEFKKQLTEGVFLVGIDKEDVLKACRIN